jgi:acetate kinase
MHHTLLLTLNAGSSSVKFAVYAATPALPLLAVGKIEGLGAQARFSVRSTADVASGFGLAPEPALNNHAEAVQAILRWQQHAFAGAQVLAVSHRVVHGGTSHVAPVLIDDAQVAALERLVPLAPLHQPHNLAGVRAARLAFPGVPQIACFDTAFHRHHGFVADTFALPRRYYDEGIRRYGFHGLSYEFIARRLHADHPVLAAGRVIVAHLGNGASMCAMRNGRSVASTMGFTALDGLPMGTRCGQLDPGVVLYLMTEKGMDAAAISHLLYQESGLKGLSGLSHDVRTLQASDNPAAHEALAYFADRCRREIGSLSASLGGLDALVLTGGIGENAAAVRAAILADMGWLGIELDPQANQDHATAISTPASRVSVLVFKTNEERMLAEHAAELLML